MITDQLKVSRTFASQVALRKFRGTQVYSQNILRQGLSVFNFFLEMVFGFFHETKLIFSAKNFDPKSERSIHVSGELFQPVRGRNPTLFPISRIYRNDKNL